MLLNETEDEVEDRRNDYKCDLSLIPDDNDDDNNVIVA